MKIHAKKWLTQSLTQALSCKFYGTLQNDYSAGHVWTSASDNTLMKFTKFLDFNSKIFTSR